MKPVEQRAFRESPPGGLPQEQLPRRGAEIRFFLAGRKAMLQFDRLEGAYHDLEATDQTAILVDGYHVRGTTRSSRIKDAMAHIVLLRLGVGPDVLGRPPALEQDGADRKKKPGTQAGLSALTMRSTTASRIFSSETVSSGGTA
jgi:hypothetical protein